MEGVMGARHSSGFGQALVCGLCALVVSVSAQDQRCALRIWDGPAPVPGATIFVDGKAVGASGADGTYAFSRVPSEVVEVRAIGYEAVTLDSVCASNRAFETVNLKPMVVGLASATVVGSLQPMRVKDSPIQTRVVASSVLGQVHAQDLMESLDFTNGVRETIGCGVCGTNDIHMNGMEGPYTLVLIDGVPLLGGLASVYALDGIPLSMIQQVEVLQGPASARFGSQAVGGVINVVLQPVRPGRGSVLLRRDSHGRSLVSASAAWGTEARPWQVGFDGLHFVRRIDDNGDGMTDAPTIQRAIATLRHQRSTDSHRTTFTARVLTEERFGGELAFEESDRGTENRYGERIGVDRAEWLLNHRPLRGTGWTVQAGAAFHQQASTYGTTQFDARELAVNADAFHSGWSWAPGQRISGGGSLFWDVYSDDTPADSDMNVLVPAVFAEYAGQTEGTAAPRWTWIHGLRVEFPSNRQPVWAPRINVKWSPNALWDARLNVGRGFRRVHLFTEEHAALDGSREVLLSEDGLNPESSWTLNASGGRTFGGDRWSGQINVQAFSTLFTDRIYADYDSLDNAILYRNLEGVGWNRGVGVDWWWVHQAGWQINAGATALRSERFEDADATGTFELLQTRPDPIEFAPHLTTTLTAGKNTGTWGWDVAAQTVSSMAIPYYDEVHDDESEPYALVHASVHRRWGELGKGRGEHRLTFGVQNLTNTHQLNPLLGADDPFSDAFDASRVYAPIEQRRFFLEWSWIW